MDQLTLRHPFHNLSQVKAAVASQLPTHLAVFLVAQRLLRVPTPSLPFVQCPRRLRRVPWRSLQPVSSLQFVVVTIRHPAQHPKLLLRVPRPSLQPKPRLPFVLATKRHPPPHPKYLLRVPMPSLQPKPRLPFVVVTKRQPPSHPVRPVAPRLFLIRVLPPSLAATKRRPGPVPKLQTKRHVLPGAGVVLAPKSKVSLSPCLVLYLTCWCVNLTMLKIYPFASGGAQS